MRAPSSSFLLAAAWVVGAVSFLGAGCASKPREEASAASTERTCANAASNPLHMTSSSSEAKRDPEIESILAQQSGDRRLAEVNRRMYQSLRSLDVELLREQRIAACERPLLNPPTREARSSAGSGSSAELSAGASAAAGGSAGATGGAVGGTGLASAAAQSSMASGSAPASVAAHPGTLRKPSLPATGGGGNGATAQKVSTGSDNDIVARRLRKAAEQETDPKLRAKLWKEYTDYRQGVSAK
jgi:hypothetical protein